MKRRGFLMGAAHSALSLLVPGTAAPRYPRRRIADRVLLDMDNQVILVLGRHTSVFWVTPYCLGF